MRTAPVLLTDAVAMGVADAADLVAGRLRLVPQWRSNRVHRLERVGANGRAGSVLAYVKQAGTASVLDGDDTVAAEREASAALTGRVRVPRVIEGRAGVGVAYRGDATPVPAPREPVGAGGIWTRPVRGREPGQWRGDPARLDVLATRLGAELAGWHTAPCAAGVRPARRPWPLRPEGHGPGGLLPSMTGAPAGSAAERVLAAVVAPGLGDLLTGASRRWRDGVWVHGDVAAGNVLLDDDAVTLLDLESAGSGDPDWDVVCALALLEDLDAPVARFWRSYREGGGPGGDDEGLRRVRTVMTAWQLAAQLEQPWAPTGEGRAEVEQGVDALLALAAAGLPGPVAGMVSGGGPGVGERSGR